MIGLGEAIYLLAMINSVPWYWYVLRMDLLMF